MLFYSFLASVLAKVLDAQAVQHPHQLGVDVLGDRKQGDLFFFPAGLLRSCGHALPAVLEVGSEPGLEAFGEISNGERALDHRRGSVPIPLIPAGVGDAETVLSEEVLDLLEALEVRRHVEARTDLDPGGGVLAAGFDNIDRASSIVVFQHVLEVVLQLVNVIPFTGDVDAHVPGHQLGNLFYRDDPVYAESLARRPVVDSSDSKDDPVLVEKLTILVIELLVDEELR